jgi:hypothetical protein
MLPAKKPVFHSNNDSSAFSSWWMAVSTYSMCVEEIHQQEA